MNNVQNYFAVLFSDVAGSTQIYDKFGDAKANHIINKALTMMTEIVMQHNGALIKTIGDEVMCRFSDINDAIEAACEINKSLDRNPPTQEIIIAVRTGLHWGPALLQEDGDLFGDMVNVAARMTGIAQARQIITTEDAVSQLNDKLKLKCREFDRTEVKGKSAPMVIYEVVWEPQDVTIISPILNNTQQTSEIKPLDISYQNFHKTVSSISGAISIGRSAQCDLVVQSPLASRNHASISYNRGKFILTDQSTNGTYVQLNSGKQFYLRRENLPISENGLISLGTKFSPENRHIIHFSFVEN